MTAPAAALLPEASADPVAAVRRGLPWTAFERVRAALGAPDDLLARALGVSERTLYRRRREEGRLSVRESDRLVLLGETFELATRALDSQEHARRWLQEPHGLLGGEAPLGRMDTVAGAREVQGMLYSVEYSMPV